MITRPYIRVGNLSAKDQLVNVLNSVDQSVSAATTQLYYCGMKTAIDNK